MRLLQSPQSAILCTLITLVLILSCNGADASDKVALQLAWKHQFQFAGYYAALHQGYYRRVGLDVSIVEGGVGKFAKEEVLGGRAQYGVAGAELLLHRKQGDPFVILAPIFQHSPSILLVRKDSGISNIQGLIDKKVMLLPGYKDADILVAFLNEGISSDQYLRLDQSYNIEDLIKQRTDAVSAYVTNEPWQMLQKGVAPLVISPMAYGVDFYSDCLFTSENEIKHHPERVQKFLHASLDGWEYAMDHPQEIIDLLSRQYKVSKTKAHLEYEAREIRKIMMPDLIEIGHMNPGRWQHIKQTYEKLGLIDADFSLDGFLYHPQQKLDYQPLKQIFFGAIGFIALFAVGSGILFLFNRKLAAEVKERKQAQKEIATQKQRAEQYLQVATVMFVSLDVDGKVNMVNEKACAILQCSKEDIIGQNWFDMFVTKSAQHDAKNAFKNMITGHTSGPEYYENKIIISNGEIKYIAWQTTPVRDAHGKLVGVLCCGDDLSEKRKLQEQLIQSQKMESIGSLAGGIAHEFNNILTIILGNNEMNMRELSESSPARRRARRIEDAGIRGRDVVKQLLTFSRQDSPALQRTDIKSTVQGAMKLIQSSAPANILIKQNISENIFPVFGNGTQINQVIINLCGNAIDAMSEKGGVLTVTLRNEIVEDRFAGPHPSLSPGKYAKLIVEDNGIGMDEKTRERVFEPYYTTKPLGKGTGIGLAVVHGIIKRHKGFIDVHSQLNRGTTFTLFFPAYNAIRPEQKFVINRV
ncbi:ABC transporter substrate-binding protein [uncultured Desulfobacter sp.]|uniref:ABC transporter substrate-binding protein n=1 Tax=uncultured Desulfobacter sp. TaxID=240139 RepID=UPI0029F54BA6|nr:ABC transporter substrate-binding protein [uncultured Desulfobacter sp.]